MNSNLRVPIARCTLTGELLLPDVAQKAQGPFCCVQCNSNVILRSKSLLRCAHFAHVTRKGQKPKCNGESAFHLAAKIIISKHFRKFVFEDVCFHCKLPFGLSRRIETATDAKLEFRVDKFIVDVALLTNNKLEAIVEIYHTHAVDQQKWETLNRVSTAVFEVRARDVINVYEEAPLTEEFRVKCQTEHQKMCNSCVFKHSARCGYCHQRNLKKQMHEMEKQCWVCNECRSFVHKCCVCDIQWCFKESQCASCATKTKSMFPNHDAQSSLKLFMLFRRIMCSFKVRWAAKVQRKKDVLIAQIETKITACESFALIVPKRDCQFAKTAGCVFEPKGAQTWSVTGVSVWRCYRWWPNVFEKWLLSTIASNKVKDVDVWNDDKQLAKICKRCSHFFPPPTDARSKICADCNGKSKLELQFQIEIQNAYCNRCREVTRICKRCKEWSIQYQCYPYCIQCINMEDYKHCPKCQSWHVRVKDDVQCNMCLPTLQSCLICKKPNLDDARSACCQSCTTQCAKLVPHTFRNPCDLYFLCKRVLRRFIVNCRLKLERRANEWFSEAFETNRLVKLRVPKRQGIFLLLTGGHFDQCWQARGQQLWTYARWLPRTYLRDFAYKHRPQETLAFWDDFLKVRAFNETIKPLIGRDLKELTRENPENQLFYIHFFEACQLLIGTNIPDQLIAQLIQTECPAKADIMRFWLVATRIPSTNSTFGT